MPSTTEYGYSRVSIIDPALKALRWLLPVLLLSGWAAVHAQPVSVEDDAGRQVRLQEPARRIVSLAPSMTELLFSLDVGDRIVGTMAYSDHPPAAGDIPVVGSHERLDMERILALRPDLVVGWQSGNPRSSLDRLQQLGLNVYIAEPRSLESIASQLRRLSRLTGRPDQGAELARKLENDLQNLRERYAAGQTVRVFYQVWHSPLISVGGDELISDMIALCGGRNVFADLPVGPKVSEEAVLRENPQVIIASGPSEQPPEWLQDWRRWPRLDAVADDHLYHVPADLVQRHSLRALRGAERMCGHIQKARPAAD